MPGVPKLFSSIVTSSIWCEEHTTLRVWIAMLATCDSGGKVEGSIPGFANLARVTMPEMEAALGKLMGPDPHSRTAAHEGRRIATAPGGWIILTYLDHRKRGQGQEGSRAEYFRARRARNNKCSAQQSLVSSNTDADADADADGCTPCTTSDALQRTPDVDAQAQEAQPQKRRAGKRAPGGQPFEADFDAFWSA